MHSKMRSTGRLVDKISEYLLFTVIDGGQSFVCLPFSERPQRAYFLTNNLSYLSFLLKVGLGVMGLDHTNTNFTFHKKKN